MCFAKRRGKKQKQKNTHTRTTKKNIASMKSNLRAIPQRPFAFAYLRARRWMINVPKFLYFRITFDLLHRTRLTSRRIISFFLKNLEIFKVAPRRFWSDFGQCFHRVRTLITIHIFRGLFNNYFPSAFSIFQKTWN